jgi:hypothetical protein
MMKSYPCCIAAFVLMPLCTPSTTSTATATPIASTASAETPAATPTTPPSPLTSVGDTVKPEAPNAVYFDFGTLSLARTEPIQHDFKLHNSGTTPVSIDRVQAACGCTTAMPDNGTPGNYKPIEPDKDVTIHVSVDPGHLYAGAIDKMVWIFVPGSSNPAVTLHMTGTMTAGATFTPTILNFNTVPAGAGATQKLTVAFDTSAYGPNPPDPISSNPDIKVARTTDAPKTAAANQIERTYNISLSSHAHIGPLQGTIAMPNKTDSARPGIGPSVFVTGTVAGDLSAAPQSVAFGSVTMGKSVTQQIVLTGSSPKALQGLKVRCGNKTLSGAVKDVQAKSAVLEVTFSPAAAGAMQSQVSLITRNGQELDLPVWAWVNQ